MSEMEILRRKFDDIQTAIKSGMNKIIYKRGVGVNEFHTNSILGDIEESNNKMLSVTKIVTTSNGNEDILPKDK